jgi:hypothetical protein
MFIILETLTPESLLSALLFFNKRLRASITKMNSSGDKGQPCLKPLPLLKNSVASPLMRTTKEGEVTQLIIHLVT